jgi:hypothetical protein
MPRGRPDPGRPLLVGEGLGVGGRALQGARADFVEARAAVHRAIVTRRERHDRLAAARAADRGVELAWTFVGSGALGRSSAGRAPLRVVDQTLAGIEGLFTGRKHELLGTIATGQTTVFVHPLQTSSARTRRWSRRGRPPDRTEGTEARGKWAARPSRPGLGPVLIAEKIRAPSRPMVNVLHREPHQTVRVSKRPAGSCFYERMQPTSAWLQHPRYTVRRTIPG